MGDMHAELARTTKLRAVVAQFRPGEVSMHAASLAPATWTLIHCNSSPFQLVGATSPQLPVSALSFSRQP